MAGNDGFPPSGGESISRKRLISSTTPAQVLVPEPPGSGKDPDSRWVDIGEDRFDDAQLSAWIEQSAALDGWHGF